MAAIVTQRAFGFQLSRASADEVLHPIHDPTMPGPSIEPADPGTADLRLPAPGTGRIHQTNCVTHVTRGHQNAGRRAAALSLSACCAACGSRTGKMEKIGLLREVSCRLNQR